MAKTALRRAASAAFPAERHDHESCVESALDRASALCLERGARLTELRRDVLALVWEGHGAVGAYHILDALKRRHPNAAPPTVYRALDFLIGQGLIHRIESLNAYLGCNQPEAPHVSQFLICEKCNSTAELEDAAVMTALRRRAGELGFAIREQTIEVRGLCPRCREVG